MDFLSYGSGESYLIMDFNQECEVLVIHNGLTVVETHITLLFNDHIVYIVHGAGDLPDTYYITPRYGYTIDKEKDSAVEGGEATFIICPMLLS